MRFMCNDGMAYNVGFGNTLDEAYKDYLSNGGEPLDAAFYELTKVDVTIKTVIEPVTKDYPTES